MSALPSRFAKFAPAISAMNPIAFPDEKAALKRLSGCYRDICRENTTAVSTAGFYFSKDAEGYIELWVSPEMVWRSANG